MDPAAAFDRLMDQVIDHALYSLVPQDAKSVTDLDLPVIQTDDDLDQFLKDFFGIRLPNVQVCPTHTTPWVAFHHAYFAKTPVSVWKASRGFGGKSFTLALLGLTEALTLRADVNVLGGSGEQSKRVLEAMVKLWAAPTAPRHVLLSDPGSIRTRLVWGNAIKALMASQASVRGPHPQRLRLDEVDEMKVGILNSALGQPMSKGDILSQVVLSSTHQYPDGTMTDVLSRAVTQGWPVHEWCYRESLEPHGWLTQDEVVRKRAIMTTLDWDTEVELQEPSSEDLAFDRDCVLAAFRADLTLEDAVDGATYASGADWARKSAHRTIIATLKKGQAPDPHRLVAWKSTNREPWPTMIGYFEDRVRRYRGPACHDGTGLGDVVAGYLGIEAEAVIMVGRTRAELFSELVHAIEHGDILIPDVPDTKVLKKRLTFCRRADLTVEHPPDEIVGLAMAYRASKGVIAAGAVKAPEPTQAEHLGSLAQASQRPGFFGRRRTLADPRGRR